MVKQNWTCQQIEAINAGGGTLLVSAAAGAGKTAVLVERIIKKITDIKNPVDVDRLLVLTFTNSAAAEMRERIGNAISRELDKNSQSKHLNRQLTLLNRASITTIHSFCLEVIRQNFHQLKLDPTFRIANDMEAALLRLEVLEELFEQKYSEGEDTPFIRLVECYGGNRDDSNLQEMVLNLYEFARSNPWPEQWLKDVAQYFNVGEGEDIDSLPWIQNIKLGLKLELEGVADTLQSALKLTCVPGGPQPYQDNIREDISLVRELLEMCKGPWDSLYKLFSTIKFNSLKRCGKDVDETLKNRVKDLRDAAKKKINGIKEDVFSRPPEELINDLKKLFPLISALTELVMDYGEAYTRAKRAKGLVDFSDLEHYCLKLLLDPASRPGREIPSGIALELGNRFEEVLVDEYQDINAVQDTILKLIAHHGNIFMVGDVKQSIYRFRLARPELFLVKYLKYPVEKGGTERRIDLNKNFRSRREIIDGVNFIFRQIMSPEVGELEYDRQAELVYGADYPHLDRAEQDNLIEVYLVDTKRGSEISEERAEYEENTAESVSNTEIEEGLGEPDKVKIEARLVAERIKEMVQGKDGQNAPFLIYDKQMSRYRPASYRDIVVLLRTTKNWANSFLDEFRLSGIPAYAETGTGYFDAIEVQTVLSLLKVIDNPRQDIPLVAVLRSPILGLTAEELGNIRLKRPEGSFYEALKEAALSEKGELGEKIKLFLNNLERWRSLARRENLTTLIWTLYRETGYYEYAGGMPGGRHRQANLRALYDRACQFEATTFRGLFRFLRFIEGIEDSGNDLGTARALGENENVVRIMSIHKSKGLEFPVVFVAGLGKGFNFRDLSGEVLFDKDLGLGPSLVDPELRFKYPTMAKLAIRNKLKFETLAEEMRILYVAMTRAKEKLILTGSVEDLEQKAAVWCRNIDTSDWRIPVADTAGARSFLDWICPAIARHNHGLPLRQLALCEGEPPKEVFYHGSKWRINIKRAWEGASKNGEKPQKHLELMEKVRAFLPLEPQSKYAEIIDKNLSWEYPYSKIVSKPAKLTVSELKERFPVEYYRGDAENMYKASIMRRPKFLQKIDGLSAAERGTAVHLVIQHLELNENLNEEDIKNQVMSMFLREIITEEQLNSIDIKKVAAFFNGNLGRRVLKAREVKREVPFTISLPVIELYPELAPGIGRDENILVQGIIDMLVDEGDGFVLIDFKTDRVKGNADFIINKYKHQLELYSRAVEIVTGRKVKESYLYLFDLDKEICF
jgi:ATP-dependent helicase/nuclease subunit A